MKAAVLAAAVTIIGGFAGRYAGFSADGGFSHGGGFGPPPAGGDTAGPDGTPQVWYDASVNTFALADDDPSPEMTDLSGFGRDSANAPTPIGFWPLYEIGGGGEPRSWRLYNGTGTPDGNEHRQRLSFRAFQILTGDSSIFIAIKFNAATLTQLYSAILGTDALPEFTLLLKSNGKLALYADKDAGGTDSYDGTGALTLVADTWYVIEVRHDATGGSFSVYVNGVLDKTLATTGIAGDYQDGHVGHSAIYGRTVDGELGEIVVYDGGSGPHPDTLDYLMTKFP